MTPSRSWREQIRSGLAALLRFFDEQPLLAQLCVVHAAGGGPRVLERRAQVMAELCEAVDRGRMRASGARAPGRLVAEGVVGAVVAVLYTRLLARGTGAAGGFAEPAEGEQALIELHGELMNLIVLPYLGAAVAARELGRSAPPLTRSASPTPARPVGRVGPEEPAARLTYRTVRVLRAIAELPAASNREVAERAGIVDQGQISKILTRLEYQGLVANRSGASAARGTPNSWWLTERGEALEREVGQRPAWRAGPGSPRWGRSSSWRRQTLTVDLARRSSAWIDVHPRGGAGVRARIQGTRIVSERAAPPAGVSVRR